MTLGPDVGTAHITIKPSLRGWSAEVRKQLRRELGDSNPLDDSVNGSTSGGGSSNSNSTRAGSRAGRQFAGGFDREVRTRIAKSLERLPPVQIGAATSQAEQDIRDLRADLERLGNQRIGVDVDAATALAEITRLQTRLTELGNQSPDIDVQFNLLGAAAQLTALQREIDRLDGRDVDIQADADTGAAVAKLTFLQALAQRVNGLRVRLNADSSPLDGMSRRTRLLLTLFGTLGPALLPLGAVLLSLAASFTATFAAAAGGIGILLAGVLGAIVPVIKAQGELEQKQSAADSSARSYAAAQQQVAAASQGVADAERSASRAVADAARALADARRSAARAVVSAEEAVGDAQDRARDAQDALNDARDAARIKLASYRDQLRGAALDESGAALSVTAAREALNNALIDSTSSQLDIDQARQALAEAELAYDQAGKRGKELRDQAKKDRAAGVSGDDAVVEARRRLADANEDVLRAERALSQARADGARSVSDAERNLAQARADGARSVAAAEQQLTQAREAAAQAASDNAKAQADLAETMAKLSGPAAVFVAALDRAKAAWKEFVAATAGDSFGLAVQVLDMFSAVLPNLVPLFRGAAAAVGVLLDDLARFGSGEEGQTFLDWMTRRAPGAIIGIGRSIGNLLKGLGYLIGALADTDTGFLSMTRRFVRWAKNLDGNKSFQRFADYAKRMGPVVSDALGAIVGALVAIVTAAAPIGTLVLRAITWIARAIANVDPEILLAVASALLAMKAASVVVAIVSALGSAFAALLTPVGATIAIIALLVGAFIYAYRNVKSFRDFVDKAFNDIKRVVVTVWEKYLKPALLELGATAVDLWRKHIGPAFREIGRIIANAWTNIIQPALKAMWWYISKVLIPVIKFLWKNVVKPYFYALANYIRFVYTKIIRPAFTAMWAYLNDVLIPVIKFLWEKVVKPIFDKVGGKIRDTWTGVIRPVLVAFRDFIRDTLVPAVRRGLGKIGELFEGLQKAAGTPVKFVVDTVFNNGIRKVINAIPGVSDIKEVDTSDWPSFAAGGVLPGYTPGRDVHRFVSPTAGVLNLSGGEGILIPQAVRQLGGKRGIDYLNQRARSKSLSLRPLMEQSHKSGGIVYVDGEPMSAISAAQLAVAERESGIPMSVMQGSYQAASDYSGTSHTGGGVMDTGPGSFAAQEWLRRLGFAAWARNIPGAAYAGSGAHVHSVSLFDPAAAGNSQASAYLAGGDGLGGSDYGPRPRVDYDLLKIALDAAGSLGGGGIKRIKGLGEVLTDKFAAALKAIAGFVKDGPGWAKKVSSMKPWGPLLRTGLHNTGDNLAGWVNDKVPGSPMRNVFDQGGLALGAGLLEKRTIRPERVLSPAQTAIFERQVDSLDGWDQSMRTLAHITGQTRGGGTQVLSVRDFRIKDWEKGIATMEVIALDAAQDVVNATGNHAHRTTAGTMSGHGGF